MGVNQVYLDSYVLQNDMRIRLPKSILNNLPVKKGETKFAVYLDSVNRELVLKIEPTSQADGEAR